MKSQPGHGKIITFYSYKGGTGRSMALANVAWILASNGKRVLVLDWDLEAPGLQRYFRPFLVDKELTSSEGVVDFLTDFMLEALTPVAEGETVAEDWYVERADFTQYAVSLNWKFPLGGQIDFVPAGRQGPDYAARFSSINFQNFYERLGGGALIEEARKRASAEYDYVLVDSRTGVSDTSGICTVQMPDTLVVCFTFNNQSIEGAAAITQDVYEKRRTQVYTSPPNDAAPGRPDADARHGDYCSPHQFQIVPVPTRVDQSEQEKLERRKTFARWRFGPFIERLPVAERKAFWGSVEVPYIPYFAYEEILAPFKEDADDPKSCLAAFVRIAFHITGGEVGSFRSLIEPEEKDRILREFASTSAPAPDESRTATTVESPTERYLRLAETSFLNLGEQDRAAAERLWKRLVRVPGHGERVENSKVRVLLDDLNDDAATLAKKLAVSELLLFGKDDITGRETVEVAHEELLRTWPRLLKWIEDDRAFLLWRQKLQTAVAEWEIEGQTRTELPSKTASGQTSAVNWEIKGQPKKGLLSGGELAEAEGWLRDRAKELNRNETKYIRASSETRRQTVKKYKTWALAACALLVVGILAVSGTYWFVTNRNKNKEAERLATLAELKIKAAREATEVKQFELIQTGVLLAIESARLSPNGEGERILERNLPLLPRRLAARKRDNNVLSVAFSDDGLLVTTVTGRPRRIVPFSPAQSNDYTPEDRVVQIEGVTTGKVVANPIPFEQGTRAHALSPDGRLLAVAVADTSAASGNQQTQRPQREVVKVLDIAKNLRIATFPHDGRVMDMDFYAGGRFLATSTQGKGVRVMDLGSGDEMTDALKLKDQLYRVNFSENGKFIVAYRGDAGVQLWEIKDGAASPAQGQSARGQRELIKLPAINHADTWFGFFVLSPDGKYLAETSGFSNVVRIWETASGRQVSQLDHQEDARMDDIAFAPGERQIITVRSNALIRLWDASAETGRELKRVQLDQKESYTYAFSRDGKRVAAMKGGLAKVWDTEKDFTEAVFLIQEGDINDLVFSADGTRVATAGADNTVRVWDLSVGLVGDLKAEACARLSRNLTADEWREYLSSVGPYNSACPELQQTAK